MIFAVLVIGAIFLIKSKNTWQGFYYPDGCLSCASKYIYSPIFETKEQCFNWANSLKTSRNNTEDLFECGLNCKNKNGSNVCEETVD
jgi:hypothetical protein